jgi:hypothetical protein
MPSARPTDALPPNAGPRARMTAESEAAGRLLGSEHPLAKALADVMVGWAIGDP